MKKNISKIRKSNFLVQVAPGRHLHGAPTPGALPPKRALVLWLQASILFFMVPTFSRLCFQIVFLHLKILFQAKIPFLDEILELENHNSLDFLSQSKPLQYAIDICRGYNFQEKKIKEKIHGGLYQVYQAVVDSI